jgi:hypothetical protein
MALSCSIRGSVSSWELWWVAAEGEECEGDEGFGSAVLGERVLSSGPEGDCDGADGLGALDRLREPYAVVEVEVERCFGRLGEQCVGP